MILLSDPADPDDEDAPNLSELGPALVITAHPDDAEFSFGATIARLTAAGIQVSYTVCSDGELGHRDPYATGADVGATRREEQLAAARSLGVTDVAFLGFQDGCLAPDPTLRRALTRRIREVRPGLVLTHQPLRSLAFPLGASHPDHLAVGEAALAAVYPDARNDRAYPELLEAGLHSHRVREVWLPGHEHTDLIVDVTRTADQKVQAILMHQSQFDPETDPLSELGWVLDRMRGNGALGGWAYAESFKRILADRHATPGPPLEDQARRTS